jgi:hypothetical protein
MKIENGDDVAVLISAFRYALGRATYITGIVAGAILDNWHTLGPDCRNLIIKEILDAKERNQVGHDCDWTQWKRILEVNNGNTER